MPVYTDEEIMAHAKSIFGDNIEEALEEKLFKTIPRITSIKTKNMDKQSNLMEEYAKRDLSQVRLKKEGYIRAVIDGEPYELSEDIKLEKNKKHDIDVVIDRIIIKDGRCELLYFGKLSRGNAPCTFIVKNVRKNIR